MDTRSRSTGSILLGEDPESGPVHINPSNRKRFSENIQAKLASKNFQKKKSLDQNQEEGWEVQDGSTRVRRVVNSGQQWKREGMRP